VAPGIPVPVKELEQNIINHRMTIGVTAVNRGGGRIIGRDHPAGHCSIVADMIDFDTSARVLGAESLIVYATRSYLCTFANRGVRSGETVANDIIEGSADGRKGAVNHRKRSGEEAVQVRSADKRRH